MTDDGIVDEVVVERLIRGAIDWRSATKNERIAAGNELIRRGFTRYQAADRVGFGPSMRRTLARMEAS